MTLLAKGELTPNEQHLATRIVDTLTRHYPNYDWGVGINGGLVDIKCRQIPSQHGYRLNLARKAPLNVDRAVMLAGGELLDRYRLPRGALRLDFLQEAKQRRDARGHIIHDT